MAGGKEGWAKPGGYPEVELRGFQLLELGDGQVQLRFDSVTIAGSANKLVPTFTVSRASLSDLASRLKLLASDLPQSQGRH